MAQRFYLPTPQMETSAGLPYAGGSLEFYESGTSTPLSVYTNPDLATGASTTVTLNSAGWPDTDIFLKNQLYRVILKDSSGNEIWTRDYIGTTDFAALMILKVGSGDPNGSVAGTAGSSGVLPTGYWDYTNAIEYRCTTTGDAATAVWTALNAEAATPAVSAPQGYLTPTSGTPIIATEVTAGTAVYYTPFVGNLCPIYNGTRMIPTEFSELTLTLAAQHLASQIYDVFLFSDSGVVTVATGPAWTTPTAGAGARGTGASTTELTRLNGYWVNAVQITGRNGSTTYTIAANRATYVGSIFMDGTNGQITCHRTWGASRKWSIWNAYHRQLLLLKAGDSTASWQYGSATVRASRNTATNVLTTFCGLAEDAIDLAFLQLVTLPAFETNSVALIGIGVNSTTAASGTSGSVSGGDTVSIKGSSIRAEHRLVPGLGINNFTSVEAGFTDGSGPTFFGTEANMRLSAAWRG